MSIVSKTAADSIIISVESLMPKDEDVAVTVYVPADKLLDNVPTYSTYVPSELIIVLSERTVCPVGDFRMRLILSLGLPYPYTSNDSPASKLYFSVYTDNDGFSIVMLYTLEVEYSKTWLPAK